MYGQLRDCHEAFSLESDEHGELFCLHEPLPSQIALQQRRNALG